MSASAASGCCQVSELVIECERKMGQRGEGRGPGGAGLRGEGREAREEYRRWQRAGWARADVVGAPLS